MQNADDLPPVGNGHILLSGYENCGIRYIIYCISFLSIEYKSISMEISIFRYLFGIEYHHGMGIFPASRSQLAEAASPPGSRGRSADAAADGVPTAAGGLVDLNRSLDG